MDSLSIKNWPSLYYIKGISNDGKFVYYTTKIKSQEAIKLVVQATDQNWRKELAWQKGQCHFTSDSKMFIYFSQKMSLRLLSLINEQSFSILNVESYELSTIGNQEWLIYRLNNSKNSVVFRNLSNNKEIKFRSVESFKVSPDYKSLVIQIEDTINKKFNLYCYNPKFDKKTLIWAGKKVHSLMFGNSSHCLSFISKDNASDQNSIYLYKIGKQNVDKLIDGKEIGDGNFTIQDIKYFGQNDTRIFFSGVYEIKPIVPIKQNATNVKIWSYLDEEIYPKMESQKYPPLPSYVFVINTENHSILKLQGNGQTLDKIYSHYAIIKNDDSDASQQDTNFLNRNTPYTSIIDLNTRKSRSFENFIGELSADGKYMVRFDLSKNNFFSYEISTGKIRNLTLSVKTNWENEYRDDRQYPRGMPRGIVGWCTDGCFLVYDRYDIWKINPNGAKPINLTNSYGDKHHIIFTFLNRTVQRHFNVHDAILIAFNTETKENGFFKICFDGQIAKNPMNLSMGPYIYEIPENPYIPDGANFTPLKAKNADCYLVRRMSATEAPNYFFTTDFRYFRQLTNIHPNQEFNWYTSELHKWHSLDSQILKGILYKPEDFDPEKKYPVIFLYYERRSDGLNAFLEPDFLSNMCMINIPLMVSKGYLVFSPDIYYKLGDPMEGAYNSIQSAALYLSKLKFVDAEKFGLQGCSFGGLETNYMVTHSDLFAAACTASGASEVISTFGKIRNNSLQQPYYLAGQGRMGAAPWQIPNMYVKNSPIFRINKIQTPLLIMHTTNDGAVPFFQAEEIFTEMYRLKKRAWLLEYPDGNHGVWGKSAEDFSIRMSQFFDHYLKDQPAPVWMTRGIPAYMKGREDGLQLDYQIKTPSLELNTNSEQ
ncbi:MAG TPA: prolyl oligopeptidase family serine peptidase [Mucilaginibacter sp.]|nr:prolyl oligopeptidase family serine peptidase [Mucilaginibacter sp.]